MGHIFREGQVAETVTELSCSKPLKPTRRQLFITVHFSLFTHTIGTLHLLTILDSSNSNHFCSSFPATISLNKRMKQHLMSSYYVSAIYILISSTSIRSFFMFNW